jgi:penicillin-binding protein 1A
MSSNKPEKAKKQLSEKALAHKSIASKIWKLFLFGSLGVFVYFVILIFQLPSFAELEDPSLHMASTVFASDGTVLGKYYDQNRTPVKYNDLSPHLTSALVATEDLRFYEHSGIDARAIARVIDKTIIRGDEDAGGGSTISQQLAKLLVGRPDFKKYSSIRKKVAMLNIKLKEWFTAVKLERSYTKQEIITLYFNQFDFLYGATGIKTASDIYFGKSQKDLSVPEAAMLVGMLKNPSLYNPIKHPEAARKRREVVLNLMREHGYLHSDPTKAKELYHEFRTTPIDVSKFKRIDHNDGIAQHFRENIRIELHEILKEIKKPGGGTWNLYRDGLKIHTTIDPRMQVHAEHAVKEHLSSMQKVFFAHWKGLDPWTIPTTTKTQVPVEVRQSTLNRQIWETERWQFARDAYMPTAISQKLRDVDVYRMLDIEKSTNSVARIAEMQKTRLITAEMADNYKTILKSANWPKIKNEYNSLMAYMKKPVKTKVFTYINKEPSEKDTLMSPYDSLRYHKMILQSGMVAIEPRTGHVKAWVGGAGFRYFKFDHVYNNHQARRQVGSTIKPLLYGLSFDLRGFSPCYTVPDAHICISPGQGDFKLASAWCPKNAGGGHCGCSVSLKTALKNSLNSVSAYLMKDMNSTVPFRDFLAKVGVDTSYVPPQPSICLGTPDISVLEMAGAYTIFANEGVYTKPVYIQRVEDRHGNIIYEPETYQRQALGESSAYAMTEMLKGVVEKKLEGVNSELGGKTGTTNDQADAWFMGVTPEIVVATWAGNDDRFIRFRTMMGQGARMARPMCHNFLKYIEKDENINFIDTSHFVKPDPMTIELKCSAYSGPSYQLGRSAPWFNEESLDNGNLNDMEMGDQFDNFLKSPDPRPAIKSPATPIQESPETENVDDMFNNETPKPAEAPKPVAPATAPKPAIPAPNTPDKKKTSGVG